MSEKETKIETANSSLYARYDADAMYERFPTDEDGVQAFVDKIINIENATPDAVGDIQIAALKRAVVVRMEAIRHRGSLEKGELLKEKAQIYAFIAARVGLINGVVKSSYTNNKLVSGKEHFDYLIDHISNKKKSDISKEVVVQIINDCNGEELMERLSTRQWSWRRVIAGTAVGTTVVVGVPAVAHAEDYPKESSAIFSLDKDIESTILAAEEEKTPKDADQELAETVLQQEATQEASQAENRKDGAQQDQSAQETSPQVAAEAALEGGASTDFDGSALSFSGFEGFGGIEAVEDSAQDEPEAAEAQSEQTDTRSEPTAEASDNTNEFDELQSIFAGSDESSTANGSNVEESVADMPSLADIKAVVAKKTAEQEATQQKADAEQRASDTKERVKKEQAEAEKSNKTEMNETQLAIAATDKLMERGGEWGAVGTSIKRLIENGGMTPREAVAYTANFSIEAPGINSRQMQYGGGPGVGIAQWTNVERWADLERWAAASGRDKWALDTQLDFVIHELQGTESHANNVINAAIANGASLEDVTTLVCTTYERAGEPHMERRHAEAQRFRDAYNDALNEVKKANGISTQSSTINVLPQSSTTPIGPQTNYMDVDGRADTVAATSNVEGPVFENGGYLSSEQPEKTPQTPGELMAQKGGEWEKAGKAMDRLTAENVTPKLASAIVGGLLLENEIYEPTSGDAFGLGKSAYSQRYDAYIQKTGLDRNDLNVQIDFTIQDLENDPVLYNWLTKQSKLPRNGIKDVALLVRENFMMPRLNEDTQRIAKSTEVQSLYNAATKQLKTSK